MPKRLIGFFKGDRHAVPGDYVIALVATTGLICIKLVEIFSL
jgi:hypothetical protein